MLVREFYQKRSDGINLYITYSDKDFYIKKEDSDFLYTAAIDVETVRYKYIETDIPIEDFSSEFEDDSEDIE